MDCDKSRNRRSLFLSRKPSTLYVTCTHKVQHIKHRQMQGGATHNKVKHLFHLPPTTPTPCLQLKSLLLSPTEKNKACVNQSNFYKTSTNIIIFLSVPSCWGGKFKLHVFIWVCLQLLRAGTGCSLWSHNSLMSSKQIVVYVLPSESLTTEDSA